MQVEAAGMVGSLSGPLGGGVLVDAVGYEPVFIGMSVLAGVMMIFVYFVPESLPQEHRSDRIDWKKVGPDVVG